MFNFFLAPHKNSCVFIKIGEKIIEFFSAQNKRSDFSFNIPLRFHNQVIKMKVVYVADQ